MFGQTLIKKEGLNLTELTQKQQDAVDRATSRLTATSVITPEQQAAIDRATARLPVPELPVDEAPKAEPSSQLMRTVGQGLFFGWGEEIEAAVRSVVPASMGGGEYEQIRDGLRTKLKDYKEANPGTALTAEIVGALVPSIIAMVYSGGTGAPAIGANLLKIGATEGALYASGASEQSPKENPLGFAVDTGVGATIGAITPFGMQATGKVVGKPLLDLFDKAREKFGPKVAGIVSDKVKEIADQVGKSYSQIVEELMDGRLMTDNVTLLAVLKSLRTTTGELGQQVQDQVDKRAKETASDAIGALRENLAPDNIGSTVYAGVKEAAELERNNLSKAYDDIFDNAEKGFYGNDDFAVTPKIMDDVTAAVKGLPEIATKLNSQYGVDKLVPLFRTKANGVIELIRKPTMRDVEKIRRAIAEQKQTLWKTGEADTAKILGELEKRLRSSIDNVSPILKETRAAWSTKIKKAELFDVGRNSLSKNVDELQYDLQRIRNNPEMLGMFREGLMDALTNKIRRNKTTFANLAKEDGQLNDLLRVAFEGENISEIVKKLDLAGELNVLSTKIPVAAGSITTPLAQQKSGLLNVGVNAASGNIMPAVSKVMEMVNESSVAKDLTQRQIQEVINVIFSQSPELVSNALNNRQSRDIFNQQFMKIAGGLRRSITQQEVQGTQAVMTGKETLNNGILSNVANFVAR